MSPDLEDTDLKKFGITSKIFRRRLLKKIGELGSIGIDASKGSSQGTQQEPEQTHSVCSFGILTPTCFLFCISVSVFVVVLAVVTARGEDEEEAAGGSSSDGSLVLAHMQMGMSVVNDAFYSGDMAR